MISTDGGTDAVWSPNGEELFYREGSQILAVRVKLEPIWSSGTPEVLFDGGYMNAHASGHANYDVSLDGERFLMIRRAGDQNPQEIRVVLNWFEELKRLVPGN